MLILLTATSIIYVITTIVKRNIMYLSKPLISKALGVVHAQLAAARASSS